MKRIKEDIKNHSFHASYLLYGEEDYLKRMYRDKLKQAVLSDGDEMNYTYFEGKDIDVLQLKEMADTLPFFSDYRIIILENTGLFKAASEVDQILETMPDTTVMVFVEKEVDKRNRLYKYISKNGLAVELNAMTDREMKAWLAVLLKQNHRQMRESTAQYLLEQIDNSMTNVQNELEKLIAYTEGRDEITVQDVDAVCCVQVTGRIFQMMDAVADGKTTQALAMYHDLLELRESPMSILYLLTRHFNILLQIKSMAPGTQKGEIAKKAGIPPFAVGRYQTQCRHFQREQLKNMLDVCIETEYQFKRGNIQDQTGVELLLIRFLQKNKKIKKSS